MSLAKTPGRKDQRLFTILNYSVPVCLFFAPSRLCVIYVSRQDAIFTILNYSVPVCLFFAPSRLCVIYVSRQDARTQRSEIIYYSYYSVPVCLFFAPSRLIIYYSYYSVPVCLFFAPSRLCVIYVSRQDARTQRSKVVYNSGDSVLD